MERSLRNFARMTTARFGLPPIFGEMAMQELEDEDKLPGEAERRAYAAQTGDEYPLEEIEDSLPVIFLPFGSLPFGPPMMGRADNASETNVHILVGEDGKLRVTGRKTGSVHVEIPIDEFPDAAAAEAIRQVLSAKRAIREGNEKLENLGAATTELRKFVSFEPDCLRNALWDKFPAFMGEDNIKIADNDGVPQLVVNNEERPFNVPEDFGRAILARQAKLDEARTTIAANEKLDGEISTLVCAKERILPQLNNAAETLLVKKALPKGERFIGFGEKKDGKQVILISREVDEPITEIPPEMRRNLILSHLEGRNIPDKVLEALGIKDDVTNIRGILGINPAANLPEAPAAPSAIAEGEGKEERSDTHPPADNVKETSDTIQPGDTTGVEEHLGAQAAAAEESEGEKEKP
ncbi:MAG: hypothetical protein PHR36_03210 [Patescibacteria group bacterium]|nr:hypothetical protein [Patescibacteria group bacterium]